jgi:hypothetical protein
VVGVAVRCHSRHGDDLGIAHVPPPVKIGDVLELGHGPIILLRVVDLVETATHSPLGALVGALWSKRATACGSRPLLVPWD